MKQGGSRATAIVTPFSLRENPSTISTSITGVRTSSSTTRTSSGASRRAGTSQSIQAKNKWFLSTEIATQTTREDWLIQEISSQEAPSFGVRQKFIPHKSSVASVLPIAKSRRKISVVTFLTAEQRSKLKSKSFQGKTFVWHAHEATQTTQEDFDTSSQSPLGSPFTDYGSEEEPELIGCTHCGNWETSNYLYEPSKPPCTC